MVSDEKGYVTQINKAAEKMLGFSQEELIGKHTSELISKDVKHAHRAGKVMIDLREKGAIKGFEANFIKKDGGLCPVELNITKLQDSDGKIVGAVAAIRDVSKQKQHEVALLQREEQFRAISESSPDAIITADSTGKILYCNKSVERIYGYTAEELVGQSIEILEQLKMRPTHRKRRDSLAKEGNLSYVGRTIEGIGIRKDGSEVAVEVSSSNWKIGGETVFGGIARDITERKQMEGQLKKSHDVLEKTVKQRTAELRKANEKLQLSEEYLKKFAGMLLSVREEERKNISTTLHDELGSMALSVTSKISIAEEEIKENNNAAAIKTLREGQAAVRKAVDDLRRVAVDLRPPNLEIMGLTAALTELLDKVKTQNKFKIIFRNELGNKKILEDRAIVIYRVIQEALTNTIKHAKAKTAKIRLYADKVNIHLDIADDGIGCDLNKALYRKGKPKIGIEGMRERVESLGGEFTITSVSRQGTQVKATVPMK
jgi:PAS domain S-box-containing protein